jgi:hypothetical protein
MPNNSARSLARRDLFILPLLSILTIAFLLVSCELVSRHFFAEGGKEVCVVDDTRIGFAFRPGCTSRVKTPEGPWVVNHYNDCGYRTLESCGPKPPNSTRIALIGSSVAQGWHIDYEQAFAERTAKELSRRCGRPVQVQNLGRELCSFACMYHRVDEALALKPDILLIAISPFDIEITTASDVQNRNKPIPPLGSNKTQAEAQQSHVFLKQTQRMLTESRTTLVAEHYLFQDPSTFLKLWLINKDKADFLRQPFSQKWEERLGYVDLILGEIATKARAFNVPVVLVEIPSIAQAAILASPDPPHDVSADALNQRLQQISDRHGIRFVNVLGQFRNSGQFSRIYYVVDGHLNGEGNALISRPIVDSVTQDPDPLLPGCSHEAQKLEASR